MELSVASAPPRSLRGTTWTLRSFTANGVTASLSADMLTVLAFGADGGVRVESGLASGSGTALLDGDVVDFGGLRMTGSDATVPGALEDRIVRSCTGPFLVEYRDGVLLLRQDGTELRFVAQA